MNKIKYLLSAAACVFALSSCEDFLTEDARGTQNLDTYFQTDEECAAFVAGCYNHITFNGWWQIEWPWLVFDAAADDMWAGNTSQPCDFYDITEYRASMPDNGEIANFWWSRFRGIANCNLGIERVSNSPIDEAIRERYVAEMRFLRGYFYFDLAKNFGGLPLSTTFLDPSQLQGIERSSLEDTYKLIEEDLSYAASILPERSQYDSGDMGHATRGAALGMLAKAQLYQGKWAECKENCRQVIQSGEYELLPEFGMVWSIHYNNSKEGVFEVQHAFDETYSLGSSLPTVTGCRNGPGDGWSWLQPTSDLENAFIAAGDTERLRWSIIKCGCTEIAGEENFQDVLSEVAAKLNSDYSSMLPVWAENYGLDPATQYIIAPNHHKSARLIRKFYLPLADRPAIYNTDKSPLNFRILRYADVLLMYAEACNETNDDTNARNALNQVRNRVGLPNVITSGNELRQAIRTERRLEFCFEGSRIYDIRRWKDASGNPVISSIMGPNGSFVKYNTMMLDPFERDNQIESSTAKGSGYREDRDLLFPIPLYEIQHSNGSLKQNPGF